MDHAPILSKFLQPLILASVKAPVLDLACGRGRNGLYLARQGVPVVFADRNSECLAELDHIINLEQLPAKTWLVDFELDQTPVVTDFSAIVVFRYLHRPLFSWIKSCVLPEGLVIYETFNVDQANFGRPKNPDFLLNIGELQEVFKAWNVQYEFEGVINTPQQSISQIACQKPDVSE